MTARTVANSTRQAAAQDALLQSSDVEITLPARPRVRLHVRKPPSPHIAPAEDEDDTLVEDFSIDQAIDHPDNTEGDYCAEGLICYCRRPEGFSTSLIACDGPCEEWYHGSCVNVTPEEANEIETFICPICARNGHGRTVWKQDAVRFGQVLVDSKDDITLSDFPRRTAIERKREHMGLSRRAEGQMRTLARRHGVGARSAEGVERGLRGRSDGGA